MERQNKYNISLIVFIIAFVFLYWEIIYEMVMDWYIDPNYSHGFLIPFISGYILWQRKDTVKAVLSTPSNFGLLILVAGLSIYLVGDLSGEYFTMRMSMLIVLAGAIIFTFGTGTYLAVLFPFLYLIFMIPLPYIIYDSIAFPLKLLVSNVSVYFLSFLGVFVLREGNIIYLTETTLEVADACSGIRSIISLLALSTAIAYLTQRGWIKRTILIIIAIPIAIVVNAVRVIGTGILADKYGAAVAEGFFHEFAGLLIFGIAIVLLLLAAFLLSKMKTENHIKTE